MLNFEELEKGFSEEEALAEARRCLKCKQPPTHCGCFVCHTSKDGI